MNPQSWVGKTLNNRYRIDELIGQGGMSTVYKGYDPNLERPVAVKIVHSFLALHDKFVTRFQREASSVARLRHPNIVQVYDFNKLEDTYYMVMEYIEGHTLQETIRSLRASERDPLPLPEFLTKIEKLAGAIGYAHDNGLVHRDLKPANIMIRPDGEPLLMDFGIAKLVDTAKDITNTGAVMGTVSYMSPEQVKGDEIDGRADLYALGVIMYELMSGRRPFEGETTFQTMMQHLHDQVPDLKSLYTPNPVVFALTEVVYKMLAKDRDERYPNAKAFIEALQSCRQAETHTAATRLDIPKPQDSPSLIVDKPKTPRQQRRKADQRITELQGVLISDPLKEDHQAELLDLLARRGDFLAALKQYNGYQKQLDQELGIEPMPETVRLREQIMSARMTPWNNLKPDITPFVGRSHEIGRLVNMILDPDIRLLTISGSGGMGKTRLARRIIRQLGSHEWRYFLHGVYFVRLEALETEADMVYAIAKACDIVLSGQDEPIDQLIKALKPKELLLVMDNFEHVTDHAGMIFNLLQEAAQLKVLVTSRHRLNLPGETIFPLTGLTYSPFGEDYDATAELDDGPRLFLQASRKLNPNFTLSETDHFSIFRICEIVDGIPLGIELAASWTRVLACHEIVDRLEQDLNLLANDQTPVTERHRDLQAVFKYSWDLLTSEEQHILAALAIFRGPFEFQAAAEIAGAAPDVIAGLVDKSLLQAVVLQEVTQVAFSRIYNMHEIVRYYAQQQLEVDPDRKETITKSHLKYYASYTAEREAQLLGNGQRQAWEDIQRNFSNIRLAWQNGLQLQSFELLHQMLDVTYRYFEMGGLYIEGHQFYSELLLQLNVQASDELVHRVRGRLAPFKLKLAKYEEVAQICSQGIDFWREQRPDSGYAKREQGLLNSTCAEMCTKQGNFTEALTYAQAASELYREIDWTYGLGASTHQIGIIHYLQGNFLQAYPKYEEALRLFQQIGEELNASHIQANLALFQIAMQQFEEGKKGLKANLDISRRWHNKQRIATNLLNLAFTNMALKHFEEGQAQIEESLLYYRETGDREGEATAMLIEGQIIWEAGQSKAGRRILFDGLNLALEIGATPKVLEFVASLCTLFLEDGRISEGRQYLQYLDQHPQANTMVRVRSQTILGRFEQPEGEEAPIFEDISVEHIVETLRKNYQ